jgi:hypothetical protein
MRLWDPRPELREMLCQRLPQQDDPQQRRFVALYYPNHTPNHSLLNLNRLPKDISENVAVIMENAESCRHRVSVLRFLPGSSRKFWSACDDAGATDQETDTNQQQHKITQQHKPPGEVDEVFLFLWELYVFAKATQVVGGPYSRSAVQVAPPTPSSRHEVVLSFLRGGSSWRPDSP